MKNITIKIITVTCLLSAVATMNRIEAQVTIGSDIPPKDGALLDLKELEEENFITARKGLGLPRVNLNDLTKLYPMFDDDDNYKNNVSGKQDKENLLHEGLMVYNVSEDFCSSPVLTKGVYVWNGVQWINLNPVSSPTTSADVTIYKDQDGNEFKARQFGSAGIWMTENLRAKTYANGSTAPQLSAEDSETDKYYCYPAPSDNSENITNGKNDVYFNKQPSIGLLYNRLAATNNENTADVPDQGQIAGDTPGPDEVENTAPGGKIQGICPNGWHLPSDREWNQLEKEIYNNPEKYSSYTKAEAQQWNPQQWNPQWETMTSESGIVRGSSTSEGHGWAMMSPCKLIDSPYNGDYKGRSFVSSMGGFDAILVGSAYEGQLGIGFDQYGYNTHLWSSSSAFSNSLTWYRTIGVDNPLYTQAVARHILHPGGSGVLFSVRCKKD